ncbi:outer membrane porin, OprD family [Stutzerimonas stutzeri]|uniref:Outer membrane porin, OprD family n=1 Tax=Stutzerimonas stutzeri TaxID=316 RepID=A0A2N8SYR7_STUST|nr:OprD family porin [Stutzerimonas stutzeri]PNG07643.1 outer membrane porin, OprD family [Stutzerimonas stutzeri]
MKDRLPVRRLLCASIALSIAGPASAAFLDDSKASVELRNFYMNRDFRESGASQSKADEWAQGLIMKIESGYTEGPVGFGLDAVGLLGIKLDSSPDRSGTGILQRDRESRRAQDDYGSAGLTAKAKLSNTTLHIGTLQPIIPVVMRNDSRLLPNTYRGAWLQSKELEGLTLDAGKLTDISYRDSSDSEEMTVFNGGARNIVLGNTKTSDEFLFAGGKYQFSPELTGSYYYGGLDGIYKQHNMQLVHIMPLGESQSFKTDLRYVRSTDDGGSNVDNDAFGALFTYKIGGHGFTGGYQKMSGDTGFAYISGGDNMLINLLQINDFGNQDEKSWQVRYDYDFAALGVPGLTLMTRYVSGDNVNLAAGGEGAEWERDTDIAYVVQNGPLKNFGMKVRNATVRSNFGSDLNETRLILSYTLALW